MRGPLSPPRHSGVTRTRRPVQHAPRHVASAASASSPKARSRSWADSDSLKIVAGGADGAKADALLAAARARGRADLESPRASEARASTFDGRHVSSLTAASVVPVASSCDTSLLTSVATAPAGRASAAEAAAAEPIDLRDSLSRERSYSAKTADGKAPPAAPATPPPAALGPPCLSFFGC